MFETDNMSTEISAVLGGCLEKFVSLLGQGNLTIHEAEVPRSLWLDELGRLRVWAANTHGAYKLGKLQDASHIKTRQSDFWRVFSGL